MATSTKTQAAPTTESNAADSAAKAGASQPETSATQSLWTAMPFASGPMFEAAQQAFQTMQQAATKGWSGQGFTLPEGVRVPGVELWTKAASGSLEGADVWMAELQSAQKQGMDHAGHLIDEMARLGKANLAWQTELAAKSSAQALDLLRRSTQGWQAGQA